MEKKLQCIQYLIRCKSADYQDPGLLDTVTQFLISLNYGKNLADRESVIAMNATLEGYFNLVMVPGALLHNFF